MRTLELLGPFATVMFNLFVAVSVVSRLTSLSNLACRVVRDAASAKTLAWWSALYNPAISCPATILVE